MDLGEFLSRMRIPNWHNLNAYMGTADGFVELKYPPKKFRTKGGLQTRTKSKFVTEYIAFLGVIRDNSNRTFDELYDIAEEHYGFPDAGSIADVHLSGLEFFNKIGAVNIAGEVSSGQFAVDEQISITFLGLPGRAGNVRFSLNDQGLKQIEVLSAKPRYRTKEKEFREYFPKP